MLDLGCGHGYGSEYLAQRPGSFVLGVDMDSKAISFARENYQGLNLHFAIMDANRLALSDRGFDAVVSFEVIEHVADPVRYLEEVKRVLKPGGLFVLSTPNRNATGLRYKNAICEDHYHRREYSPKELELLLRRVFAIRGLYCEFSKTDLNPLRARRDRLSSRFPITLRRATPRFIKNIFLRTIRLPTISDTRKKWRDFRIEEAKNLAAMDSRYPVQIFVCARIETPPRV